jgi:hypothetical protein
MNAITRSTSDLKPHPLNESIYGDRADADLIASIRAKGILNPLLISAIAVGVQPSRRGWLWCRSWSLVAMIRWMWRKR